MKSHNNILKRAFILADMEDFGELPKEYNEWTPSEKFEKKMSHLIGARKNPFWIFVNTVGKRVAVIVFVFIVLCGSAMSVEAIREPVVKFIVETYEKYTAVDSTTGTAENSNDTSANTIIHFDGSREPKTYYGSEFNVIEIDIPADGESISYDRDTVLYSDADGNEIKIAGAERHGDKISFWTHERDYYFDLDMLLLTSNGELFIQTSAVRLPNKTYRYDITLCESDDPALSILSEIRDIVGNYFDESMNYYCIRNADLYSQGEGDEIIADSKGPTIYYGLPFNVEEIELPADGESITYSPTLVLYSDKKGRDLEIISAERQGDMITFYTNETDHYYFVSISILTSDGELFVALNAVRSDDNTYKYETERYETRYPNDPTLDFKAEVRDHLGEEFDENKNYYCICYAELYYPEDTAEN